MIYLQLFWEFFKTGLFSVGGGLATLPFLYEMADRTGWFTVENVADMLAVSESTPGAIGVNMATYTGFTTAGILGSVVGIIGLILPSIVIIIIIAAVLKAFRDNFYVRGAFYGIRPASTGLIAAAGLTVLEGSLLKLSNWQGIANFWTVLNWQAIVLAVLLFIGSRKFSKLHPVVWIAVGAAAGIVFRFAGA